MIGEPKSGMPFFWTGVCTMTWSDKRDSGHESGVEGLAKAGCVEHM